MVPVLFAFMGFAIDLGRLYLIRGELKTAANAMALAAAQKLIGTDASAADAANAAKIPVDNSNASANKYDFGGLVIGDTVGNLSSEVQDPEFFDTLAGATGQGDAGGGSSSTARHVRISVKADAPLVFWSFLSLGQARKTEIDAQAVAGVSAPLCTACNIEPFAIQAADPGDTTDFGLVKGTRYTFGYVCQGTPTPPLLANTSGRLQYLILNRLDQNATLFPDESSQLYRIGATGLPPNQDQTISCMQVNAGELIWATAMPGQCSLNQPPGAVTEALCGLNARFDPTTIPSACESGVAEVDTIASAYIADSDLNDISDYVQYTGNLRRVITVPIVDQLAAGAAMTVLGFRQFLLEPAQGGTTLTVPDTNGRFAALYIGSVVPLRSGSFSGCRQTSGPGKVVLHQ